MSRVMLKILLISDFIEDWKGGEKMEVEEDKGKKEEVDEKKVEK